MMAKRVLVIGLDGGTWQIFDKFMAADAMPNMQRLCEHGYKAPLMSTVPAITPTAWTSLSTGMNPGKHGAFGFTSQKRAAGGYVAPPVRRDTVEQPSLWRRLSEAGKTCYVLSVPMTFPAEPINGGLVTGMFTPDVDSHCVHPPELKEELLSAGAMPMFRLDVTQRISRGRSDQQMRRALENDGELYFKDLLEVTESMRRTVFHLLDRPWDLFFPVFIGTDRIQHVLHDKIISIGPEGKGQLGQRIRGFYQRIDEIIGEMVEAAGKDTLCVLMSDHGFGPCAGQFSVGRWLLDNGYSNYQPRRLHKFARAVLDRLGAKWFVRKKLSGKFFSRGMSGAVPLDWSNTRAFFVQGAFGVRANVRGREQHGIVEPGAEFNTLIAELRKNLADIADPVTGRPVIKATHLPSEIYHGPELEWAPDIILEPSDELGHTFARGGLENPNLVEPMAHSVGSHRSDGILLFAGPDVRPNHADHTANITDVAPTVLRLLGLPVPTEMDGELLEDAFHTLPQPVDPDTDESENGHEPLGPGGKTDTASASNKKQEQIVAERLRNLGYLD